MAYSQGIRIGAGLAACLFLGGYAQAQTSVHSGTASSALRRPVAAGDTEETQPYSTPESSTEGVLREMANRAAVIFTGSVSAVRKGTEDAQTQEARAGNASAFVVEVDFAVDQPVKGAGIGAVYTMREWAGLWRDSPRFAVGQRLLMLLHAPGPGGLSSPVDGLDGAIPIRVTHADATPLTAMSGEIGTATPQDAEVDMRWLQAKTLRAFSAPTDAPIASPGENFAGTLATTQNPGDLTASAAPSTTATVMAEAAPTAALTHVLGLLASWQETGNALR